MVISAVTSACVDGSHIWHGGFEGCQRSFDRVDLVGSWERDINGKGKFVWLGNVFDLDKLMGKGTWDSNMDINVVLVWTTVIAGAVMDGGGRAYFLMRFWGALASY